ncbi:kynureninase [Virgibacillus pantothenticus]|uniref:Kynureninase n=1 Tax=Virgibacillus pantothenticus TaxID=1473 RepID=A0A0L0QKL3_VIRPA|nr:kynureninase [Virgibacillus pantothenticus]KNE19096.1 kynureninase [Virgibacillus pantothenticus]MBU8567249.1 kynureninase [Virgibacillus pantothenticus]MBU8600005.1 kynureninase [Virgibacillus pantothenticus]MBU8635414.1 kynureninase [Virgibacillus pantothenticus]MBU8642300.1 kynureninase [Virgibacillus pantothenticus]
MKTDISEAKRLDEQDPLSKYREEFYTSSDQIYFDGNSLGLLSTRAEAALHNLLASWKQHGIDGWTEGEHPWFYLSEKLGAMTAPLIGAHAEEVIITGSTTTNLHQLTASFFHPEGKRTKILADELNFPSDIYALQSQLQLKGFDPTDHLVKVQSTDGNTLQTSAIMEAMTEEIALIILPGVLYRSGQILDMETITKAAHQKGIKIGFDLCHSIGAIPHQLSDWEVDFAFWCTYKHLNGGPGSVGGLYVNKKHFSKKPGLAGWFSSDKAKQFDMEHSLSPANNAGAYQIGTPHVLSAAPLLGSLEMISEIGIEAIRGKSLQLTAYLMELVDKELFEYGFTIANPRSDSIRGGHVYLEHAEAARICKALKANGVIPDFRKPNGIRLAPVALYNTYTEVWQMVQLLKSIMKDESYKAYENKRGVIA